MTNDTAFKVLGYRNDTVNVFPVLRTIWKDGNQIRSTLYADSNSNQRSGDQMNCNEDGGCYLACNYQYMAGNVDCNIVRVDKNDSVIWSKNYGVNSGNWWESPSSIINLSNNNKMVACWKYQQYALPNMKSYTWLFEIDSSGNMVRQWFDSDSTMEAKGLMQTKDGGFVYASKKIQSQDISDVTVRATVVKLDSNFVVEWRWEHPQTMGSGVGGTDIEELPNGDLVICGKGTLATPNYSLSSAFILKLSADGTEQWKRIYTAYDTTGVDSYLNDIDVLPDGSYVAVGYVNLSSSVQQTQRQQAWILKVDSNGCVIENCVVGIDGGQMTDDGGQMQVWPNPASGLVTITLPDEMQNAEVRIIDVAGKVVKQLTVDGGRLAVDVSALGSGVYFVVAEKNGKYARAKFIVE